MIEKKEGHIRCLMDEIAFLKDSHKVDFEELKLEHELQTADLEMKLKRIEDRLVAHEGKSEFEDILATYNS